MKRVRYVQQTARDDRTKLDRVVHELGDSRRDLTRRLPRVPATSRILSGTFGEHPPRASGRASSRCAFSRGRNISLERRRLASPPLILHFFRVFTETRSRDHLFPSQFNSTIRCILMIEKRERERERERERGRKRLTVRLRCGAVSRFGQKGSRPSISCRVVFVRARTCNRTTVRR